MSRILWLSNAPWTGSGYAEQTRLFVPRLQAQGHDVAVMCNFGLQGARFDWQGILCYPSDSDWGNTAVWTYAEDFKADHVIALCDAWVLKPDQWPDGKRMAVWAPVDHYPIPPAVLATLAHKNIVPIAMSRFGEQLMTTANLNPVYVPHGVDTNVFYPRPEIRDGVRDDLGIPRDAFLVGMVAANKGNPSSPRKGFPQAFHAFAQFAKTRPDAHLYVHSEALPTGGGGGISLDRLAVAVGTPTERVSFAPEASLRLGLGSDTVAAIYQAFDVLLAPSMGEGFGIPILEAQTCGVPVITSDHSAMSELGRNGWLVCGDPWWDALQDSFFIAPSLQSIVAGLEDAYANRDNQDRRDRAAEFGLGYDADLVADTYWRPALERVALPPAVAPISNGKPSLNRAQRRALAKAS